MIFARPFPHFITPTHQKNISFLQDLMLSSFIDKNCLNAEDFDDLQAEIQTLWLLAGKQILFDFTKFRGPGIVAEHKSLNFSSICCDFRKMFNLFRRTGFTKFILLCFGIF